MRCYFVSDLHGSLHRYKALATLLRTSPPDALFLGGDLFPAGLFIQQPGKGFVDFVDGYLLPLFTQLCHELGSHYPAIYLIPGNDDPRSSEQRLLDAENLGLWHYLQQRSAIQDGWHLWGYSYIPPSPFLLKDWERYDVSGFVDVGCVSPEAGTRTVPVPPEQIRWNTIARDLAAVEGDLSRSILLFHAPPYQSDLDRAALDGQKIDHVPLDVHVGSIAIQRFIAARQPHITLHGHIHESPRITGHWMQTFGKTTSFSAAHDGPQLAVIRFDPAHPETADRVLL